MRILEATGSGQIAAIAAGWGFGLKLGYCKA
jgi:hypothetical protein